MNLLELQRCFQAEVRERARSNDRGYATRRSSFRWLYIEDNNGRVIELLHSVVHSRTLLGITPLASVNVCKGATSTATAGIWRADKYPVDVCCQMRSLRASKVGLEIVSQDAQQRVRFLRRDTVDVGTIESDMLSWHTMRNLTSVLLSCALRVVAAGASRTCSGTRANSSSS